MATEFTPESPQANHMRAIADVLRTPESTEVEMDYEESNQPGEYE
jgi:hypothetical protein